MVILTYHRITEKEPRRFYENSTAQVRSHIELLLEREHVPFPMEELGEAEPPPRSFLLTFDDATIDHLEIVNGLLGEFGLRGVFFVPTERLGAGPRYLADDDVRTLAAAGNTIGCHGHLHQRMDRLDEPSLREQLEVSSDRLEKLSGSRPVILAPPGGYSSERVRTCATAMGFCALRTMQWGRNDSCRWMHLQCLPANRHTDARALGRFLEGRRRLISRLVYGGKELLKKAMPDTTYARIRNRLLGR